MNTKRLIYLTLIVATLSIGVIIGTIVSGGVKATSEQKPAVLAIPDPVSMSNSFSQIAEQLEPAVVNIHVVIAPQEPVARCAVGARRPAVAVAVGLEAETAETPVPGNPARSQ